MESIRQPDGAVGKVFIAQRTYREFWPGCMRLIGAAAAYFMVHYPLSPLNYRQESMRDGGIVIKLLSIAIALVLALSLITGYVLANRKANKQGVQVWNSTSKRLVINLAIPLVTGRIVYSHFIMERTLWGGCTCLPCFYGLALLNASANLFDEIRYLGYCEIGLGLICAASGLWFTFLGAGFGVLHVLYGTLMYKKYDR
jgi:hypothetical protein